MDRQYDWRVPGTRSFVSFPPGEYVMKREAGEECVRIGSGIELIDRALERRVLSDPEGSEMEIKSDGKSRRNR